MRIYSVALDGKEERFIYTKVSVYVPVSVHTCSSPYLDFLKRTMDCSEQNPSYYKLFLSEILLIILLVSSNLPSYE